MFTLLKVAMVLAIVSACFGYSGGSWHNFAGEVTGAKGGVTGFMAALVAALWAYDGWNDLNMVAGEVKRPEKTIPRGTDRGGGRGRRALHDDQRSGAICAAGVGGGRLAACGQRCDARCRGRGRRSIGSRGHGSFHVGNTERHGDERGTEFLMRWRAMVTCSLPWRRCIPVFRTPAVAIVVQCALAAMLLGISGKFRELFSLAIFSEWLFYMVAASTVFVFRRLANRMRRDPTECGDIRWFRQCL